MNIIPAIDILNNKIVRLKKGDYNQVDYYDFDIIELVEKYYSAGFRKLHLVDLLGAKEGKIYIHNIINSIKKQFPSLEIQFGGGIRNLEFVQELMKLNVDYFVIGSLPIINKDDFEKILDFVGCDKIILAADVFDEKIVIKGWIEKTDISIYEYIDKYFQKGITTYLCTDINKDGMLEGPNFKLYNKILQAQPQINLIASGGISKIDDVILLKNNKLWGCVLGKSLLEGKIKIEELKNIVS